MRIGVYCGSFNPVHKGHIKIARACIRQKAVDRVLIIPTGNYWDKQNLMPVKHRIEMLREYESESIVIDSSHNDIQYTCELFRTLQQENPDDQLCLIIGGDNLPSFGRWMGYQELLQYDFVVIPRDEINAWAVKRIMKQFEKTNYTILKLRNIPISSTHIRENLDDYSKVKGELDRKVYNYLLKHKEELGL